ncbi:MAG: hypothetical protein JRF42_18360 [Deltaproteobacteria bacterium]|nr:hypothetical protein [Deltaproteobacteria bacterium]
MFRLIAYVSVLAALLAPLCFPSAGLAQAPTVNAGASQDREPADPELERAHWKRTRARIGVAFSFLTVAAGFALLAPGIIWGLCDDPLSDALCSGHPDALCSGHPEASTPLLVAGSILIASGLVGMGFSARGLYLAKRQVRELEHRPAPTALRFGPAGVTLIHCF